MFIPEETVEEIREKNDIVDVISSYVRLTKKGSTYFGLCPFHNEKTGSFSVSPAKQMYYCFGCHEGGNVITFLQKYENYTFPEALKVLAERAGVEIPDTISEEDKKRESKRSVLLGINKEAGKYYYYQLRSENGSRGMEYLKGRGLSDETLKQFGLGFARPSKNETYNYLKSKGFSDEMLRESGLFNYKEQSGMMDKFWNRVIFPIMDTGHRIIGFGGRVMGEGEPKYLNSPETLIFDKSRNLYGLNHAKSSKAKNIIICEGYMDVISLHQAGFNQAVASLGTAFTSGHANLLSRYARVNVRPGEAARYKDILLCYDSDGAGVDAAKRALTILRQAGLTAKVINLKPYKDPDEFIKNLGAEEFEKRIEAAENGFLYEVRMLESEYDLKDPGSKSKFFSDVALRILRFEDAIEREAYTQKLAYKYGVSVESIDELVKKHALKGAGLVEKEKPQSTRTAKYTAKDGIVRTQGMLLNWISEMPEVFPIVSKYIKPEDFTNELYGKVAGLLYEQIEKNDIKPADIVSVFQEEEEQRQVAELFHTSVDYLQSVQEKETALRDLMYKVKEFSNNNPREDDNGQDAFSKMIENKNKLEEIKLLKIDLSGIISANTN